MTTRLILVKHSQPEIIQDVPAYEWRLSANGRIRAMRLAEHIKAYGPEVIVSSAESKAIETAEILAGELGLSTKIADNLHEHDRRNISFLPSDQFEHSMCEFFERPDELVFGNETAKEAYERFHQAVDIVMQEHQDRIIALVAHGTVISLFISRQTGVSGFSLWKELGLPSFVVFDTNSKSLLTVKNIT